jgi:hypothetical protein
LVTSRVPALIDYLVTAFTASTALGQATPAVSVFDGPPVTLDPAALALYVGVDDVFSDSAPVSATSDQIRQGLAQHRQETAVINCAAVAWSGADDMRTVRSSAFAILAAAENLVRTNNDGFGGNAGAALPGISGITLQQSSAGGSTVQVAFAITFVSFIGS